MVNIPPEQVVNIHRNSHDETPNTDANVATPPSPAQKPLDGKMIGIIEQHKKIMKDKEQNGPVCNQPEYINQCAIRVSKAIQDSGIDMADYPLGNKCKHGHARDAQTLWGWILNHSSAKGGKYDYKVYKFETPEDVEKFYSENKGKNGFVYFELNGKPFHIDTFDGTSITDHDYTAMGMKVYFREIK